MSELLIPFFVLTLIAVVVIQGVERYFYSQQVARKEEKLLDELSKAIKAVIAKNANDYVMTTSIDKVPTEERPKVDPDIVSEDELTDEQFMTSIKKRIAQ